MNTKRVWEICFKYFLFYFSLKFKAKMCIIVCSQVMLVNHKNYILVPIRWNAG